MLFKFGWIDVKILWSVIVWYVLIVVFYNVEFFLLFFVDVKDDGRIILFIDDLDKLELVVVIKYVLLNFFERFKEVVEEVRSVILVGGIMEFVCLYVLCCVWECW